MVFGSGWVGGCEWERENIKELHGYTERNPVKNVNRTLSTSSSCTSDLLLAERRLMQVWFCVKCFRVSHCQTGRAALSVLCSGFLVANFVGAKSKEQKTLSWQSAMDTDPWNIRETRCWKLGETHIAGISDGRCWSLRDTSDPQTHYSVTVRNSSVWDTEFNVVSL